MNDEELHVLKLLTIAAIAYAEWNDIIVSKMRDNKEIAKLYMQLPTVQGTVNHLQLLKLKNSKIDVNVIKSIEDLIKVIN